MEELNDEIFIKLLGILKSDLDFYRDMIREVSTEMISEGYTQYPVFIAHQHEVKLGEMILDKADYARDFNINASTLEELVEKGVVQKDREDEFKKAYKDPRKFMCVFLVTVAGAKF